MKGPQKLLTIALALTPVVSAWTPWVPLGDSLVVRQDDTPSDEPTKTPSPASKPADDAPEETGTSSPKPTPTGSKNDGKDGDKNNGDKDGDDNNDDETETTTKGSPSKTSKGGKPPKHTTFNALDPAGGVNMIYPPMTAPFTLYRIDDDEPVTWRWNYTSLQGKPTAVDVLVSCSRVTSTWTLTQNMTFAPTATFTWNINEYNNKQVGSQLPVEKYTLLIHDSDAAQTDTPEPGYLAPYAGFQFGLYTARPYDPLNEWKCATCNSAPGGHLDRQALSFAFGMTILTVLSFTWYVTGLAGLV
ncbi:hypothetical protein GGS20DRAFT_526694 [Poronia punctata]|nr:hypothetical protein GGS20DRAFT_526694 [Poronia punctata]